MCASCGCGRVNDNHGDERHLIMQDLQDAAEAADISVAEVVQNLQDAVLTSGEEDQQEVLAS